METRSRGRARAGQSPGPPEGALEDPGLGSPIEEDLGLVTLMGDGAVPFVGGDQPEVRATTGQPGEVPAGSERVPAREPVSEPSELQPTVVETVPTLKLAADGRQQPVISTLAYASDPIPTNALSVGVKRRIEMNFL